MAGGNQSSLSEFLLLGLSDRAEQQQLLFVPFLCMYLLGVLGNLLIVLAIGSDRHLHTPMYFFLSNLSAVDACFLSTTVPKMLCNIQTHSRSISFSGCLAQMYFFMLFVILDNFLLTGMAYDRFVAICHPLRYAAIMNPWVCALMVGVPWITVSLISLLHTLLVLHLSFCSNNKIFHFFCEISHILKLSCSDTLPNEILIYFFAVVLAAVPLTGILVSYSRIISTILKMPSVGERWKAFSTCGSHLSVVILFYGTGLGVYFSPGDFHGSGKGSIASVMYTVVTPMLNPFIYSLRNKDIKGALRKLFSRKTLTSQKSVLPKVYQLKHKDSSMDLPWSKNSDKRISTPCSGVGCQTLGSGKGLAESQETISSDGPPNTTHFLFYIPNFPFGDPLPQLNPISIAIRHPEDLNVICKVEDGCKTLHLIFIRVAPEVPSHCREEKRGGPRSRPLDVETPTAPSTDHAAEEELTSG
ncbi:olfactory receptor 7G3-like [Tachyglossus aculeatus]|uniref:olfactory receptor 7G3-like n=1 Tax=Tachyglossus aculeatus TaxID=9261 RepID=UPI0018F43B68|nr:olfactory receptor 7G3-like [Tachyglossus aculeatus]